MERIIHQIIVNGTWIPEACQAWMRQLQAVNPTWDYRLHRVDPIADMSPRQTANIERMRLLAAEGGVYADWDVEAVAPLDTLDLSHNDVLYCECYGGAPHHGYMACAAGNATAAKLAGLFADPGEQRHYYWLLDTWRVSPDQFALLPPTALIHHFHTSRSESYA